MKYIFLIVAILFGIQSTAISQRGHGGKKGMILNLKSELELSDAQTDELKNIFETMKEEAGATSREDKKAAIDAAIAEVLTEDQLAKFEELKEKRSRSFGKRGKLGRKDGKMSRDRKMDEEIQERLIEMRTELDQSISADDKILINELRQKFNDRKKEVNDKRDNYKELSKEEKKEIRNQRKIDRDEMKVDIKQLKALGEKYETEIASLFEENNTFFEDKRAEQKAEWMEQKEMRDERNENKGGKNDSRFSEGDTATDMDDRKRGKRGHSKPKGRHLSKYTKFLLVNPIGINEDLIERKKVFNNISVSPNPASFTTNVSYEVKTAGHIRVEIKDELGRVYEVIANETMEAGTYSKSIDITKYQDKAYYVSISDGKSINTEKLLIQK